jgi:Rieske 2Fe-2S family protein
VQKGRTSKSDRPLFSLTGRFFMTLFTVEQNRQLAETIAKRKQGFGLPREFYQSAMIYEADLARIWRRGWLFAGHTCQITNPGDYFTMRVGDDSLIIIRDDKGTIQALYNICRHRGTELCDSDTGHVGRFICPYHQWVYARDGALVSCRGMAKEDLDKSEFGLLHAHIQVVSGMIFVCLAESPPSFEAARASIEPMAAPQGFERAKVAKIVDYQVGANWKLVWENNRECYHCNVNHPQYIKANYDHFNADDTTPVTRQRIDAAIQRSEEKWQDLGLAVSHRQTGMAAFPDAERDFSYAVNRTAMAEGYVSETMDGRQVAPLMGDYTAPDVGTFRLRTMPNFWNHSSCDHAVSTRLLPTGVKQTHVRVLWLVDQDAVEGQDYRLDEIMPFWQLTSEQDWDLCARAQRGVDCSRYEPGPFSSYKEYNVNRFVDYYLRRLAVE